MQEITTIKCYEYTNEIVVELIGRDSTGEIAAVTYHFPPTSSENQVQLREDVDPNHADAVKQGLADAGYTVES